MNPTNPELNRLYWHSRRGMLELDLLLVPFAEQHLQHLTPALQQLYKLLLVEEDQDLYSWLSRRAPAPNAQLQTMIEIILAKHEQQKNAKIGI
ncbi:MAG: succinate dehydrogenase assembly factor 2 [Pseudomonadota bacterium]